MSGRWTDTPSYRDVRTHLKTTRGRIVAPVGLVYLRLRNEEIHQSIGIDPLMAR